MLLQLQRPDQSVFVYVTVNQSMQNLIPMNSLLHHHRYPLQWILALEPTKQTKNKNMKQQQQQQQLATAKSHKVFQWKQHYNNFFSLLSVFVHILKTI